jgi:hypothetical protein
MWVETERNKVGVGSGGGFLGDFELGGLLGTSGDDVTSVSFKESVVNGSRTELVGWVGNSNIEFHEESSPISRSKILTGALIIDITDQDPTSADWATFFMKFDIAVTNPTNKLGSTTIDYALLEANTGNVITTGAQKTAQFEVTKKTATGTNTNLVSFGLDPHLAANTDLGVGAYSNTYCNVQYYYASSAQTQSCV